MRLMVVGGAGYIGSHMCKMLFEQGHEICVVDNLSTGHRAAVRWGTLHTGDIRSSEFLSQVFQRFSPEGVLHFAAKSQVGESTVQPAEYYSNNVVGTLCLLDHIRKLENCFFVFSSTAAIFGEPRTNVIDELHPRDPITAYGRTKLSIEFALEDYFRAYGLRSVSFRYFNAAGADPSAIIGEAHEPETHLIPKILESVLGRGTSIEIYGDDYETPDGTCIRDYVHVNDLCAAHLAGIDYVRQHPGAHFFNLGNGSGFSVREVLAVTESIVQKRISFAVREKRSGDPVRLVADSGKAAAELGWRPQLPSLDEIVATAWRWHCGKRFS